MARFTTIIYICFILASTSVACKPEVVEPTGSNRISASITPILQIQPSATSQISTPSGFKPTIVHDQPTFPAGMILFGTVAEDKTAGTNINVLDIGCVMDAEGCMGQSKKVADGNDGVINDDFSWSPDGQRILFVSDRNRNRGDFDVYTTDTSGTELNQLTDTELTSEIQPSWSPDGNHIAYVERSIGAPESRIAVLDLLDLSVSYLPQYDELVWLPAWSPEGDKIAYIASDSKGGSLGWLYIVDLESNQFQSISNKPIVKEYGVPVEWSPDGSRIAFTSIVDDLDTIAIFNIDNGELVNLKSDTSRNHDPAWASDGEQLAFSCRLESGDWRICSSEPDTGSVVRELIIDRDGGMPIWYPVNNNALIFRSYVPDTEKVELFLYVKEPELLHRLSYSEFLTIDPPDWWAD